MRYIAELKCLCARKVAEICRNMTFEERYKKLQSMPKDIRELVTCFPMNFITWCVEESVTNSYILSFYIKNKEERKQMIGFYEEDCFYGLIRKPIILRKCGNYYCNELTPGKIILENTYNIRSLCCNKCFIPFASRWVKLRSSIQKLKTHE